MQAASSTCTACAGTSSRTSTRSGCKEPHTHEELDPIHWGLTIWDLDREFPTGGLAGKRAMKLRDILGVLRDAYARTIGVEYMHIQEPDQKAWIQRPGRRRARRRRPPTTSVAILGALNAAEAFERFLHTKYLGQKRFSLEGAETLIPMLAVPARRSRRRRHGRGRDGHVAPRPAQRARQHRRQVVRRRSSASSKASSTRTCRRARAT